jgi:hypothetical protein
MGVLGTLLVYFLPGRGEKTLSGLVPLGAYILILLLLGAWSSEETWEKMAGWRKAVLFVVALPAYVASVLFTIGLVLFALGTGDAAKEAVKIGSQAAGPLTPSSGSYTEVYEASSGFGATPVYPARASDACPWRVRFVPKGTFGAAPVYRADSITPGARAIQEV